MKLVLLITQGLLRDQHMRRKTMFFVVLAAMAMAFAGSTFLADALRAHVLAFILFWGGCAWLTILAVLMAIFDILVVGAHARAARRKLHHEVFGSERDGPEVPK